MTKEMSFRKEHLVRLRFSIQIYGRPYSGDVIGGLTGRTSS